MSQDIQLSSISPMPMQGEYIPGGGMPGGTPPNANPLAKLHKLLRGRYPVVIILGLIFGVVGGAVGWIVPKQLYIATGQIQLSPIIRTLGDVDRIMPMFNSYIVVQQQILQSPRLIQAALKTQPWQDTGEPTGAEFVGYFAQDLLVDSPKNSTMLTISYTHKDEKTASAGVAAIIAAYTTSQNDLEVTDINDKRKVYDVRKFNALQNIAVKQNEIQTLGVKYGTTELAAIQSQRLQEMVKIQAEIDLMQANLENALIQKTPTTKPVAKKLMPEDLAPTNGTIRQKMAQRDAQGMRLQQLLNRYGKDSKHQLVLDARAELAMFQESLDNEMALIERARVAAGPVDEQGNPIVQGTDPDSIREGIERSKKSLEIKRKQANDVTNTAMEIQKRKAEIAREEENVQNANRELDGLDFRKEMLGRVTIINGGDNATLVPTKRPLMAAAGFLGGLAVPVGLMMLIGLMDSRLRYSDETDTDMSGITLLGILPNLPDRLSDPEQAATAAHCVHQIRTMLQINGAATEQSVFAMTSASPGDGKTSLTLALGLSFAACGSRTLLIDCDLVGAGLTRRLGVQAETGILEAALNRSVLENIRTTEITDVAILPVGTSGALHASTLSPNALRRIIHEAKKHFDVILIDTGPILGSIEASLVATVADGIVLTVARGQHRQIVEKSLRHLMSIGAKIAGVVFNRAQARDFERSLSNMSMRSVGLIGTVDATNRYGPLGRAVQSSGTKGQ